MRKKLVYGIRWYNIDSHMVEHLKISKGSTIDGSSSKLFEHSWCICRWGLSVPNASCCLRGQRRNHAVGYPGGISSHAPNNPNIHFVICMAYIRVIFLVLIYIYILYRIIFHPNVTLMVICIEIILINIMSLDEFDHELRYPQVVTLLECHFFGGGWTVKYFREIQPDSMFQRKLLTLKGDF